MSRQKINQIVQEENIWGEGIEQLFTDKLNHLHTKYSVFLWI